MLTPGGKDCKKGKDVMKKIFAVLLAMAFAPLDAIPARAVERDISVESIAIKFDSDTTFKINGKDPLSAFTEEVKITGTPTLTSNTIAIDGGGFSTTLKLTLSGVNIKSSVASPLSLTNKASVDLTIMGANTLTSAAENFAGLQVSEENKLAINGTKTDTLTATGGGNGAGIGGNGITGSNSYGVITINNGTVIANGGGAGAGIGGGGGMAIGGKGGGGGSIIINNGTVVANGGDGDGSSGGAGIGGGGGNSNGGDGGTIAITGGTVIAKGGGSLCGGAGIGGGGGNNIGGAGGDIAIIGFATVITESVAGNAQDIGGGGSNSGAGANITIATAGTVYPVNGKVNKQPKNSGSDSENIYPLYAAKTYDEQPMLGLKISGGGLTTTTALTQAQKDLAGIRTDDPVAAVLWAKAGIYVDITVKNGSKNMSFAAFVSNAIKTYADFKTNSPKTNILSLVKSVSISPDATPAKISATYDETTYYAAEPQADGITYLINLPAGTAPSALTKLKVDFVLPTGATISPANGSEMNFSGGPVNYTVTAEDGTTTKDIIVDVRIRDGVPTDNNHNNNNNDNNNNNNNNDDNDNNNDNNNDNKPPQPEIITKWRDSDGGCDTFSFGMLGAAMMAMFAIRRR